MLYALPLTLFYSVNPLSILDLEQTTLNNYEFFQIPKHCHDRNKDLTLSLHFLSLSQEVWNTQAAISMEDMPRNLKIAKQNSIS
jgi:hypothetical protein